MSEMDHFTLGIGWRQLKLPLPGLYPIITWQLNVTAYTSGQMLRVASAIREPSTKDPIAATKFELEVGPHSLGTISAHCQESLRGVGYLSGFSKGI